MVVKNIKPLGNRVLVQRSKAVTTKGGIFLPETAKEKPKEGVVIAVGPGKLNDKGEIEPMNLKVGDVVLFTTYAGMEVATEQSEEEYLIMAEQDILGVVQRVS